MSREEATADTADLAPWASPAARARIAEVAAGQPDLSPAGVRAAVHRALAAHERRYDDEGIVLYAGTNVMSPAARQAYRPGGLGGGPAAAIRLAAAGIYLSAIGLPWQRAGDPAGDRGLGIGAQEVTRRGFGPAELRRTAAWMADVLVRDADPRPIRAAAAELRADLAGRAESPVPEGED